VRQSGYDIIVIGGGHAGCEAALAAARMGMRTALVTLRRDRIGHMPCNPAVGGLAKGHLVKELDALGGEIGRATDRAGIQFRMLNRKKGPAVWSPRAQCDKVRYAAVMQETVAAQLGLDVLEAEASRLEIDGDRYTGLRLADGTIVRSRACVLTAGTFLRGLMHTGGRKTAGGREGEPPAEGLAASLRSLGLRMGRLKTGTPPRVLRSSVDLSDPAFTVQPGDARPAPFSYRSAVPGGGSDAPHWVPPLRQVSCHLTHTNEHTHEVIRENLERSPMYSGTIEGIGPRYCPSIEDKVVRFADRDRHQVFVEPEGLDHPELYLNGISTSLPVDVQLAVLATIPGFERASMARPGYAVEYDFFPPDQVARTMASKEVRGLYFAGQVNGTSGYEEAAAQGFVAGVNAVLELRGDAPFVPGRDEGYIGVMLDDLTTKEIDEPYRMFTSRAEYRLLLRQDNADERLMPQGVALGLVPRWALEAVEERAARVGRTVDHLIRTGFPAIRGNAHFERLGREPARRNGVTLAQVLKRPDVSLSDLREVAGLGPDDDPALDAYVESAVKYAGYIDRQARDIAASRHLDDRPIPGDFPFASIGALSREAREKLQTRRPETVGQASRIAGVRAADLSILLVHLERHKQPSDP
jgi:tRNA uridine 5-carboxymethylaminomethyl modification enzyme